MNPLLQDTLNLGQWKTIVFVLLGWVFMTFAFSFSNLPPLAACFASLALIFFLSSHDAMYAEKKRQAKRLEDRKYE